MAGRGDECGPATVRALARRDSAGLRRRGSGALTAAGLAVGAILAAAPLSLAQPVRGDVVAVGFGATSETGRVARPGQWIPILCDLQVQGSQHFQGELACEMEDLDGDRVSFRQSPVVLTGGGAGKRVWLYVTGVGDIPREVDVISSDGAKITTLDVPQVDMLSDNALFILDISERPVARLDRLQTSAMWGGEMGDREYYRPIAVGRSPANELPDQWYGLESVDAIVWDKPDPAVLNPAQTAALIGWVKRGGRLVVGVGDAWPRLRESPLAEIVPLRGEEPSVTAASLQFPTEVAFARDGKLEFESAIPVCTAKPIRGQPVVGAWIPGGEGVSLIVMDTIGAGRVTTVATGLSDLLRPMTSVLVSRPFFMTCFDLNQMKADWIKKEQEVYFQAEREERLYPRITAPVDFASTGAVLRMGAIGFVILYIFLATGATWWWLNRRSMTTLSWSAFAACAVIASVLSLGMVAATRGFTRVHGVAFYNMVAGEKQAAGPVWFGYRSPTRQEIDLSMPGEGNYLRAMSQPGRLESRYATPERYAAYVSQALLKNTPMRASLKQFEGYRDGPIDGSVLAQIVIDRGSGQVRPESWILNDLPVPVSDGWLLYLDPRYVDRTDSFRPFGAEKNHRNIDAIAAENVLAIRVGEIKTGGRNAEALGKPEYDAWRSQMNRWLTTGGKPVDQPDLPTLRDRHLDTWMATLTSIAFKTSADEFRASVMLASTRNLYLHLTRDQKSLGRRMDATGMVDRDISHWLTRDQAVLVLFSERPGPAGLHRGGQPLETSEGMSVWRIRAPISLVGSPAPATPPGELP